MFFIYINQSLFSVLGPFKDILDSARFTFWLSNLLISAALIGLALFWMGMLAHANLECSKSNNMTAGKYTALQSKQGVVLDFALDCLHDMLTITWKWGLKGLLHKCNLLFAVWWLKAFRIHPLGTLNNHKKKLWKSSDSWNIYMLIEQIKHDFRWKLLALTPDNTRAHKKSAL